MNNLNANAFILQFQGNTGKYNMLTEFTIRCSLPLPIWWNGFLPDSQNDWLKFEPKIGRRKVKATIGITDRLSQINVMGDLPDDLSKSYFPGKSLVLTFQSEWSQDLIELMRTNSGNEKITRFRDNLKEIINSIYAKIIDILRNHFGQYWISPTLPRDNTAWNDAEWLDSDGNWKPLFRPTIYLESRIRRHGMSKEDWDEFGTLLKLKYNRRSDMISTMIANARSYLEIDNGRMAVVEVVTALEAALKQILPKLLSRSVSPPIPEKLIDKAIKKLGLRLTAQILFEHMKGKYQLDPDNCKQCLDAITERNQIIHKKQRDIDISDAKQRVESVATIISSLSNQ
jgi:hypothetical protein